MTQGKRNSVKDFSLLQSRLTKEELEIQRQLRIDRIFARTMLIIACLMIGIAIGYAWRMQQETQTDKPAMIIPSSYQPIDLAGKISPKLIGLVDGYVLADMDYDNLKGDIK